MALRISAPRNPTATVIFLHGLGDSGHGWSFLPGEAHQRAGLQHVNFVLPHAPNRYFPAFNARQPGWLDWPTSSSESYLTGLRESVQTVKSLIDAEISQGIDPSRIVIGGFSQGAALTQSVAATYRDHKLAGFLSLSGFLPAAKALLKERSDVNTKTPLFIGHGTSDPVVPFEESETSRDELVGNFGFTDVEFHAYPGLPHSVSPTELDDLLAFLERVCK